jgi:hypothetical protein
MASDDRYCCEQEHQPDMVFGSEENSEVAEKAGKPSQTTTRTNERLFHFRTSP